MNELPKIPNFMNSAGPGAVAAGNYQPPEQGPALSKLPKEPPNRIQAIRLAAAMEKLHDVAHDPSTGEDGRTAAATLAMTMLQHFPVVIWALRQAGKPGKR